MLFFPLLIIFIFACLFVLLLFCEIVIIFDLCGFDKGDLEMTKAPF